MVLKNTTIRINFLKFNGFYIKNIKNWINFAKLKIGETIMFTAKTEVN